MTRSTRSSRRRNGARGSIRSLDSFSNESFSDDDHSDGCGSITIIGLVGLAIVSGLSALCLFWQPCAPEQEQWCQGKPAPVIKPEQQDPQVSSENDTDKNEDEVLDENESEVDETKLQEQRKHKKERDAKQKLKNENLKIAKQKVEKQKVEKQRVEKLIEEQKIEKHIEKKETHLDEKTKEMGKDLESLEGELKLLETWSGTCCYVAKIPHYGCYIGFGVVICLAILAGVLWWLITNPWDDSVGNFGRSYWLWCVVSAGLLILVLGVCGGCAHCVKYCAKDFVETKLEKIKAKGLRLHEQKDKTTKAKKKNQEKLAKLQEPKPDSNAEESESE